MPRGYEIRLAARPVGAPRPTDFELVQVDVPPPSSGQLLVRNTWMSVDPAMRPRMDDVPSYAPPFELGQALDGAAVGEVIASGVDNIAPGDTVLHWLGWRDLALIDERQVRWARVVDVSAVAPQTYLGTLGHVGLTAYVGLFDVAALRDGDIVFVSGAAGAVGSLVGQMAKLRGHRVIGSAGSDAKVAFLVDELGFDAAFNYRATPVGEALPSAAPDGIDVYFDNVGGDHLEAAIDAMRAHGRIAICGTISTYNDTGNPPTLRNQFKIVGKRLTLRGFLMIDHVARMPDFLAEVGGWVRDGRIVQRETIVEGLEHAPEAMIGVLSGDNMGKMLVRIG